MSSRYLAVSSFAEKTLFNSWRNYWAKGNYLTHGEIIEQKEQIIALSVKN